MDFKKEDFQRMTFNIYGKTEPVVELYPKFLQYKEFKVDLDLDTDKVLRYIIFAYDINTPLHSINEINKRKKLALSLAKFETENGKYPKEVEDIVNCNNHAINDMIIRFTLMFYVPKYAKLMSFQDALQKETARLYEETDPKLIHVIRNNIENFEESISKTTLEIFRGDDNKNLAHDFYEDIDEEMLEVTPEAIAKKLKEGKKAVKIDPYK